MSTTQTRSERSEAITCFNKRIYESSPLALLPNPRPPSSQSTRYRRNVTTQPRSHPRCRTRRTGRRKTSSSAGMDPSCKAPNEGDPEIRTISMPSWGCLPLVALTSGQIAHLPTRAEAQALLTLADAYVLEIPVQDANNIMIALDQIVEKDKSTSLSHLRRLTKSSSLPRYLEDRLRIVQTQTGSAERTSPKVLDLNNVQGEVSTVTTALNHEGQSLFLLVGLTRLVNLDSVLAVMREQSIQGELLRTRVPISPPMNPTLAREWSDLYWPTQYRKSTPLGPHPTVVRQGTDSISAHCGFWISQVINAAREGRKAGLGPAIGALVVDSKGPLAPAPVAIAVDARYGSHSRSCEAEGNIMNHAVMRAIGLVGRKRMSLATPPRSSERNDIVLDYPLLSLEEEVFLSDTLSPGGYLCTGLDIYLTHEPCVMCAQAILHSRFDKVVFRRRMSKTGAATPERPGTDHAGLGYGLFWRPELNWRLLVWEWKDTTLTNDDDDDDDDDGVTASMHA